MRPNMIEVARHVQPLKTTSCTCSSSDFSDHSLLRRFRRGEDDAATELYMRYANRLQAFAKSKTSNALTSRFDPDDVVQSVFRTFFRRVSEGMYNVPPGEELWHLLLVLALNKVRTLGTFHRAQKRDVTRTLGTDELYEASQTQDEGPLHYLEMVVNETLDCLPESQRQMVQMRIEGYAVDDISQKSQRSRRTVERILQRFRQNLSRLIEC